MCQINGILGTQLTIVRVNDARLRRKYIQFPYRLYRGDACWVPPLRGDERKFLSPRRNPFLVNNRVELFLCCRGEVVGLIAAVLNRDHQRQHRDRCGFFGQFECVNDPQAAALLLQAAAAWLKDLGCDTLRGPASFSLNGIAGLLTGGFDRSPAVLMAYNPPYYRVLLEGLGLRQVISSSPTRYPGIPSAFRSAAGKLTERFRTTASASAPSTSLTPSAIWASSSASSTRPGPITGDSCPRHSPRGWTT